MSYEQCISILAAIFLIDQDNTDVTRKNAIEHAELLIQEIRSGQWKSDED